MLLHSQMPEKKDIQSNPTTTHTNKEFKTKLRKNKALNSDLKVVVFLFSQLFEFYRSWERIQYCQDPRRHTLSAGASVTQNNQGQLDQIQKTWKSLITMCGSFCCFYRRYTRKEKHCRSFQSLVMLWLSTLATKDMGCADHVEMNDHLLLFHKLENKKSKSTVCRWCVCVIQTIGQG